MVSPLNDADFTPLWVYCTGRALTWTFWSINDLFPWVLPCFFVALWPVQRFGLLRSSNLNYTLLLCNYITVRLTVTVITLLRLPHTLTFWLCSIKRRASHTLGLATIGLNGVLMIKVGCQAPEKCVSRYSLPDKDMEGTIFGIKKMTFQRAVS